MQNDYCRIVRQSLWTADGPAAIRGPRFVQFLFGRDEATLTAKLGPGLEQGDKKAINYCPGSPAFYGMNDLEPGQI